jgi:AraC-like DNA-binding protein
MSISLFKVSQILGYVLPVFNLLLIIAVIILLYFERRRNLMKGKFLSFRRILFFLSASLFIFLSNVFFGVPLYESSSSLLFSDMLISKTYLVISILFVLHLYETDLIDKNNHIFDIALSVCILIITLFDLLFLMGMDNLVRKIFNYVVIGMVLCTCISIVVISLYKSRGSIYFTSKSRILESISSFTIMMAVSYLFFFYFLTDGKAWIANIMMTLLMFLELVVFVRTLYGELSFFSKLDREDIPYRSSLVIDEGSNDGGVTGIQNKLCMLFETEKLYLRPNLSIGEVADRLITNKSYLSKILNVYMEKNFREFVNHYRVVEAMRLFNSNNQLSLNDLCKMCGFRNIASFTNAFKLHAGKTPGNWCRTVKSSVENGEKSRFAF